MKTILRILPLFLMIVPVTYLLGAEQDQETNLQLDSERSLSPEMERGSSTLIDAVGPGRAILIPAQEVTNPSVQRSLNQFLEDCPYCEDAEFVPIIVDPTPKNPLPKTSTPRELCEKYPPGMIVGCPTE